MTENEAKERCDLLINSLSVNNGVESAFRNDFKGYMDFTTMREFAQTCKKALEEVQQYRTIGTPEEFRAMAEKQTAMKKHCDEEVETCKWIKYDYRTICPKEHDADNPYWRIPENMDKLKYCPYCGKEIRVIEN